MPVQVTYPGVYIEEIPSGSKTISGVATSITAFIGRALRGPTDRDGPMTIFGFDDFTGTFGGLNHDYPMAYAVQDFFMNGGSQAVIVRLFKNKIGEDGKPISAKAALVLDLDKSARTAAKHLAAAAEDELLTPESGLATPESVKKAVKDAFDQITGEPMTTAAKKVLDAVDAADGDAEAVCNAAIDTVKGLADGEFDELAPDEFLQLEAANPGKWGNILEVTIDREGISSQMDSLYDYLTSEDLFNLTIQYTPIGGMPVSERHINLSINEDSADRRVDRVLANESILVRVATDGVKAILPGKRPDPCAYKLGTPGYDSDPLDAGAYRGNAKLKTGMYALRNVDIFNLMCIPPDSRDETSSGWNTDPDVYVEAAVFCTEQRAMLIMDPPDAWTKKAKMGKVANIKMTDLGNFGDTGRNAAVYFPRVVKADPMLKGAPNVFPACGMIAGIMSSTDVKRGVWKAPAGVEASLIGARSLELKLTDNENGLLNPQGINCLRTFPVMGSVVWGARTLRGADQLSDDYKYINVRRLTLYIEESLFRGTQWAVFEPNDATLWTSLKETADSFMAALAKQGAFYSYQVVCDGSTTTARDINLGIVNMLVAFAPVKPAEFVVIKIQQQALKD